MISAGRPLWTDAEREDVQRFRRLHPVHVPHTYAPLGDEIRNRRGEVIASATCRVCGGNAVAECHR